MVRTTGHAGGLVIISNGFLEQHNGDSVWLEISGSDANWLNETTSTSNFNTEGEQEYID